MATLRAPLALVLLLACACSQRASGSDAEAGTLDASDASTDVTLECAPLTPLESAYTEYSGSVELRQVGLPGGALDPSAVWWINGYFYGGYGDGGPVAVSHVGDCVSIDGYHDSAAAAAAAAAGTVSVTGAYAPLSGGGPGSGYYGQEHLPGAGTAWTPGELISVSSTGGVVPAFDAAVMFPPTLELLPPQLPFAPTLDGPDAAAIVSSSSNLTVHWAPQYSCAYVVVWLYGTNAAGTYVGSGFGRCAFPISAGTGSIPASFLAQIAAAAPTNQQLWVATTFVTQLQAGQFTIQLRAENNVYAHYIQIQ